MKKLAIIAMLAIAASVSSANVITNHVYVVSNIYNNVFTEHVVTQKIQSTHYEYYFTNNVYWVTNVTRLVSQTNQTVYLDVGKSYLLAASNQANRAEAAVGSAQLVVGQAVQSANNAASSASAASASAASASATRSAAANECASALATINARINWFDEHSGETITQVNVSTNVMINKNKVVEIDADGNVWEVGQSDLSQYGAPTTILATGYSGNVIKLMGIAKAVLYVPELDQTTEMFFYAYEGDADIQYYSTGVRVPYVGPNRPTLSVTILHNANTGKWETYGFEGQYFRTGRKDKDSVFVSGETVANYTLSASSEFVGKYLNATKFYVGKVIVGKDLAEVATSGSYDDLLNKPTFATVASSGSYNDLIDKPEQSSSERMLHKVQSPLHRRYLIAFYYKDTDFFGDPWEGARDWVVIQTDRFSGTYTKTYENISSPIGNVKSATVSKSSSGLTVSFSDCNYVSRTARFNVQLDINDELSMPALNSKTPDMQFYFLTSTKLVTGYLKIDEITDLERTWSVDYYISSDFNIYDSSDNKIGRLMLDSDWYSLSNWVERVFQKK